MVGCRIPDTVVFPEYNALNPDMHDPKCVRACVVGMHADASDAID